MMVFPRPSFPKAARSAEPAFNLLAQTVWIRDKRWHDFGSNNEGF
ncbi:hypothetical protein [Nitrobacter sp.]|jgi:hypothetical protein